MNFKSTSVTGWKLINIIFAAGMAPTIIFLLFANDVIIANINDLLYNKKLVFSFFIAFIIGWIFVSAIFKYNKSEKRLKFWLRTMTLIALFLVISDIIRPHIDTTNFSLLFTFLIDIALAATIIFILRLIPKPVLISFAAVYSIICIVWVCYTHLIFQSKLADWRYSRSYSNDRPYEPTKSLHTVGNVYHIILDGYHSELFNDMLSNGEYDFTGFTQYRFFNTNYPRTASSLPGLLRSQILQDNYSFNNFYNNAPEEGFWHDLKIGKVPLSLYPFLNGWCYSKADYCYSMLQLFRGGRVKIFSFTTIDLWFLKILPNSMRKLLNPKGTVTGFFTGNESKQGFSISKLFLSIFSPENTEALLRLGALGVDYQVNGLQQFERFLHEERQRPATGQYVFWHGMFPHGPWVVDKSCRFKGKGNYGESVQCATLLAQRLIDLLKETGKFDDALIIFQSDHGNIDLGFTDNKTQLEASIRDTLSSPVKPHRFSDSHKNEFQNENASIYSNFLIELFSSGLLLVKWPHAKAFSVSDLPVQGIDVAPTILKHFNLYNHNHEGIFISIINDNIYRDNVFIATTRLLKRKPVKAAKYVLKDGEWKFDKTIDLID